MSLSRFQRPFGRFLKSTETNFHAALRSGTAPTLGAFTGWRGRGLTFEEKRKAVMAIEAAVLPLMPTDKALAA
jgi:hypothetical protein